MMRSLWVAKTGLDAQQNHLDVISNNLANTSTNGFKRQRAVFEDLLYQNIRQPGAQSTQQTQIPSGLSLGTGVRTSATQRIFAQGNIQQTENPLDIAIQGEGFLPIQMPDGTTAYTRDGSLTKNAQGQIVTQSGNVLQPPITIPAAATSVTIGQDGTVSVVLNGNTAAPQQLGNIQLVTFINSGGLQALGDNLFMETAASGNPNTNTPGTNGAGTLRQGFVEVSNVNVAEELVSMIQTQRAYEMNSKAITTSDQMLQRLSQM